MLEYLKIKDLALIENMELEFAPGMNVLTGETGAGKSFILKAINFLLGEKMSAQMVRPGSEKAQVEALFLLGEDELILRRDLLENGRSRFFLNGELSSQDAVRELRGQLMLHVGQHGQQRLLQPAYQARLVDMFLQDPGLLDAKDEAQKRLREVGEKRKALHQRVDNLRDRRELLEMQQQEIEKVSPQEGEEEALEEVRQAFRSVEHLRHSYDQGFDLLRREGGLLDGLAALERLVDGLVRDDDSWQAESEAISNFREQAKELERRFSRAPQPPDLADSDLDISDMEDLESRLFELAQLKRKLRRTLPEILNLKTEIDENLSFLDSCELDLRRLNNEEFEQAQKLQVLVEQCNAARHAAAEQFCRALESELAGLGFSEKVRVEPEFTSHSLWPAVKAREGEVAEIFEERVRLLWAPNPGLAPQPLDRIASGGELSRFLLAVISLQAQQEEAMLVFDEVDAGVGGHTLTRVAKRLEALAARRQMLLITHWPQLAARGKRHFLVSKEEENDLTYTRCQKLDAAGIKTELARMAGEE